MCLEATVRQELLRQHMENTGMVQSLLFTCLLSLVTDLHLAVCLLCHLPGFHNVRAASHHGGVVRAGGDVP